MFVFCYPVRPPRATALRAVRAIMETRAVMV